MDLTLILASLGAGFLFGAMDGLINANPLAVRLNAVYAPVARPGVNALAGIVIDLVYGVVLVLVFRQLAPALPGAGWMAKGLVFGLGLWFFRVVMSVATTWMTHRVPSALLGYRVATGLVEMLVLGVFLGLVLRMA